MIYLDHNASSPPDPLIKKAVFDTLETLFANPASNHRAGRLARRAVEKARVSVAKLINASPSEIVFTSGGTESDTLAILGCFGNSAQKQFPRPKLALSRLEHHALLYAAEKFSQTRGEVLWVDTPSQLSEISATLVSVMLAQNETGEIFDVANISRDARQKGAIVHSDAVQAIGKIPVDVEKLGVDLLSISGHKFGAFPGIGALYIRRKTPVSALFGGVEEQGRRGGTLNVPGIVSLGMAATRAREVLLPGAHLLAKKRDELVDSILSIIPGAKETVSAKKRLPNTAHILFPPPCDGEELLTRLDEAGICVSTGAACASGAKLPSHVLLAMGVSPEKARGSLRISLGPNTSEKELEEFVRHLPGAYEASRKAAI